MEKKNNDINFTAADIEKYHRGLMDPRQMHALERAALDDPFLADAIEGYHGQPAIRADIEELRQRLDKRTKEQTRILPLAPGRKGFSWWKVAAMIIVVAGAALIVYQTAFNNRGHEIAQETIERKATPATTDSAHNSPDSNQEAVGSKAYAPATVTADDSRGKEQSLQKSEPASRPKAEEQLPEPAKNKEIVSTEAPAPAAGYRLQEKIADKRAAEANAAGQQELKALEETETNKRKAVAKIAADMQGFARSESNVLRKTNVFRGRVTDQQNNALAFSNIINTRDSIGTYADANGFFNLTSPDSVLSVKVSSLGFEPSTVKLRNDVAPNRIKLEEDRTSLSEVVLNNKKPNSNRQRSTMVLQQGEPADGWLKYDLYLANNIKEPDELKEKPNPGTRGVVELSFEVNEKGEPMNITVKKSLCESCDKEAIRLLKEGPKWKRRAQKGKTTVTITF